MPIATPAQLRAARLLLGFSQSEVADRAGLATITVKRSEGDILAARKSLAAIQLALEAEGIESIAKTTTEFELDWQDLNEISPDWAYSGSGMFSGVLEAPLPV